VSNRNGPPNTKRTQSSLLSPFSSSSDFLPLNYASVKGAEEKIYAEHQKLKGYTRLQAQDSYISTTCASPAYNTVFFHCQEAKRKILRIQNTKLGPVLIGIGKDGAIRADFKTKEILDVWPYKVLKNWGYTENTFILEFDDRTYPLKTPQGRWMNALVDFHIESILGDMTTPPVTHQEMGGAVREEIVPVPHNRDDVDEMRAQAQQWRAELANGKPSTSSSPPSSPPTPHHLLLPPTPSSIPDEQQSLPAIREPADYEEVEFGGVPTPAAPLNSAAVYDVLRRDWEDDDAIYETPTES
ncbi:Talin-2, partial [Geodia barretti]